MDCSSCQQPLTPEARFCDQCGQRVSKTCVQCDHRLRPAARFCDQCGTPQPDEATASAPASVVSAQPAERRQLTVMFCDLVGSTQLAHRLDAESLREVVAAYQEHAAVVLRQFEGHVAQYLGDGLLVYFGYPQAYEDAAERAVRAGWRILQSLDALNTRLRAEYDLELAVRIGINTGTVVVGEIGGGGQRRETLALGATPNVAARLEGLAETNTMVISESTQRLIKGLFALRDLGTPELKGVAEPMRVYQILDIRRSLGDQPSPSQLTPLVGRRRELGRLLEIWPEVSSGRGRAVLISGEAGFGKSRLVKALWQELGTAEHFWLEGNASTFTRHTAFAPVIQMIEQELGVESVGADVALARLEERLARAGLGESSLLLLAELLSLPTPQGRSNLGLSSELQREKTMQVMLGWILGLSRRKPVVLVQEDLQWCDPSTLELLGLLEAASSDARLLVLMTCRDEFEVPWGDRPDLVHLPIGRLSTEEAGRLVERLSGKPLPEALVAHLIERGDGNPLYLEELTKMVLESDPFRHLTERISDLVEDMEIPSTLRDSLTARLDRLGRAKGVAQIGAVLGRRFSYALLDRLARSSVCSPLLMREGSTTSEALVDGLDRLVSAQLLFQTGRRPEAGYAFKHALVENAAYQSLLRKTRQKIHAEAARILSTEGAGAVRPEVVARHYQGANLWHKSATFFLRAGVDAVERAANVEAVEHLQHGLDLLGKIDEGPDRQRLEMTVQTVLAGALATSRGYGHPEVGQAVARALELLQRFDLDSGVEIQQALMLLWTHHFIRADFEQVNELSPRLLAQAEQDGTAYWITQAEAMVGAWRYFEGDFSTARAHFEKAIEVYRSHRDDIMPRANQVEPGVFAHAYSAFALLLSGQVESGWKSCHRAVELARQADHPQSIAFALFMATLFPRVLGDVERVHPAGEESLVFSTERGFPFYRAMTAAVASVTTPDEATRGLEIWRLAIGQLEAMSTSIALPTYFHMLAEVCIVAGQLDEADATLRKAFSLAQKTGQHYADAELYRVQAQGILAGGDLQAAIVPFRKAIEIARQQGALLYELRATHGLARVLIEQGERSEAHAMLKGIFEACRGGCSEEIKTAPDWREAQRLLDDFDAS